MDLIKQVLLLSYTMFLMFFLRISLENFVPYLQKKKTWNIHIRVIVFCKFFLVFWILVTMSLYPVFWILATVSLYPVFWILATVSLYRVF